MRPHPLLADAFGLASPMRHFDPSRARTADEALDRDLEGFDWGILPAVPPRRVLLLVPAYPASDAARAACLSRWRAAAGTRHRVTIRLDDRAGVARLDKVAETMTIAQDCDWLIVADDDVAVGDDFLDRLVAAIEAARLMIAQPAHRIHSYASFTLTQRREGSIARVSRFVEIGPVIAMRPTVMTALPWPSSRWGWGVDMLWADLADRHSWRLGIVDGVPIEHLRPINYDLPLHRPLMEASHLLRRHPPRLDRRTMLTGDAIIIPT